MGWGDIAHQFAVHPGTLGHSVANSKHAAKAGLSNEQASMTARNTATGKSDASASSAGKGNSGGSGKGGGKWQLTAAWKG